MPEASLQGLNEYVGPPSGFWSAYLQRLLHALGASAAWVMVRKLPRPWQVALNQGLGPAHSAAFAALLLQAAQQALEQATVWLPHEQDGELLAASLPISPDARAPQAVLLLWFELLYNVDFDLVVAAATSVVVDCCCCCCF